MNRFHPRPADPSLTIGDVNGPFIYNKKLHLQFQQNPGNGMGWGHVVSDSLVGPWEDVGYSLLAPNTKDGQEKTVGYISGSVSVIEEVPYLIVPLNNGNNPTCCDAYNWDYPCVASPPTETCFQQFMLATPIDLHDPFLTNWTDPIDAIVVDVDGGVANHGWVQQDPSHMWVDPTSSDDDVRYLFLAGTSVNGTEDNFNGLPIIEVLRSRTSSPSDGFDFLSTFSSDGLQMCDPELVTFGNISLVYVCTNEYLVGKYYYTDFESEQFLDAGTNAVLSLFNGNGNTFAPKGFLHEDGRYLMWATIKGGTNKISLTYEMTFEFDLGIALVNPVEEYKALRSPCGGGIDEITTITEADAILADVELIDPLHLDLEFELKVDPGAGLELSLHGGDIVLGIAMGSEGNKLELSFNGGVGSEVVMKAAESVQLRIIIDDNVAEIFCMGGRQQLVQSFVLGEGGSGLGIQCVEGAECGQVVRANIFTLAYL